jgi:hypothetical protein
VSAGITDGKFGINQIFDVQYWWNGTTLNASNFIAPYNKNFQTVTTTAGQYFQFFPSTTNPGTYGLKLMNSNGTQHSIVHDHGDITALGNGAIFYIGSGFFGNVITTAQGYSYGASAQFTNMDTSVTSSDLNNYTYASTTPLAAGQTAAPTPNPTNIYTSSTTTVKITNIWPTSNNSPAGEGAANAFDNNPNTKYLNFDKYNAGVTVKLSQGRVVSGFTITTANDFPGRDPTSYKLYGSNDGKTWVLINQGTLTLSDNRYTTSGVVSVNNTSAYFYYYIQFPTTKAGNGCGLNCDSMQIAEITYIYDTTNTTTSTDSTTSGSTPVDPVQAASVPQYPNYVTVGGGTAGNMTFSETSTLTTTQQGKLTTWTNKTVQDGNRIYIDQVGGDNNTVTMEQDGNKNLINLTLQGSNNNITARQGVPGIGQNEMKLNVEGNNSVLNLNQSRDIQGNAVGGNGHYLDLTLGGWGANVAIQQTNSGGVGGHFNETTIYGNGNNVTAKQTDNGNKIMFLKVDGALNTVEAVQKGTGQHKLDATLTGNSNSASILQEGSVANNATLNLTNAGGPASVVIQQNGGQSVGVTTSCATAGGCAPITVRQGY